MHTTPCHIFPKEYGCLTRFDPSTYKVEVIVNLKGPREESEVLYLAEIYRKAFDLENCLEVRCIPGILSMSNIKDALVQLMIPIQIEISWNPFDKLTPPQYINDEWSAYFLSKVPSYSDVLKFISSWL